MEPEQSKTRERDRQTDRQTDSQTDRDRGKDTETQTDRIVNQRRKEKSRGRVDAVHRKVRDDR